MQIHNHLQMHQKMLGERKNMREREKTRWCRWRDPPPTPPALCLMYSKKVPQIERTVLCVNTFVIVFSSVFI